MLALFDRPTRLRKKGQCDKKIYNIILNSVRQHNYFITQGNYIGYMFRLLISHLQAYFVI